MATSNPLGPHFSPTLLYSAGSEPFIIPLISMTNSSASHGVDHVSEVFVVETHSVGKKIIGNLRNRFTITSQTQRGDFYLDQSRVLLQKHAHIINAEDQDIILDTFTELVQRLRHRYLLMRNATGLMSQREKWKPATLELKDISRP
jgi:hypothetical protein